MDLPEKNVSNESHFKLERILGIHLMVREIERRPLAFFLSTIIFVFAVYLYSPVATAYDSRFVLQTAHSFLHGQSGDLSAYQEALEKHNYYCTEPIHGIRSIFPIGTSLLCIPFVAAMELVNPDFASELTEDVHRALDKQLGALFTTLGVAGFGCLIWVAFRRITLAIAGMLIIAFATSMWSTASRGMWQHGPLVFLLSVALLLLIEGARRPGLSSYSALPLAAAFIVRPTSAILIIVFGLYILIFNRREFLRFSIFGALIGLPWIAFNLQIYNTLFPPYYLPSRLDSAAIWTGLSGQFISPARGILVFSPIVLLAGPGFWIALRDKQYRALHLAMGLVFIMHCLTVARFGDWYGGHSYGPRYMTDMLPILIYFFIWTVYSWLEKPSWLGGAVVAALLAVSIMMHAVGALNWRGYQWNTDPTNINQSQERLWDWSDPQFLRFLD